MNTTRKIVVSILATSFLGATALPTLAQQSTPVEAPKMEKRTAHAGGSKRGGGKRHGMKKAFERYDADKDGVITQDEVDAVVIERFNDVAGEDGTITLEQFREAWMERSAKQRVRAFQRLDRDGDGSVTTEEYDAASGRMFSRLDRDGSGDLTRPAPDAGKSADRTKGHGKKGMRGGSHRGGGNVVALMERFDVDKDGKITRAEFDEVRAQAFSGADADGNSAVTLEEFATIWQDVNSGRTTRAFQRMDADGDLKITADEYSKRSKDFVKKHDRNGDGVVTKADRGGGKHKGKKWHRSMKKPAEKAAEPQKTRAENASPVSAPRKLDI
jgi:Ca2+-binding EF-hand superfamily protein